MEVAEALGHSCVLKAEELSLAIMEEEELAYGDADKLMESMQSLRPLLMMSEEGNSSECSGFLNAYDIEQDILLSCDELSQDNWSLDPLNNEPPHYPTWIRAINFEELGKHMPNNTNNFNTIQSINESQTHEDLPNSLSHSISPSHHVQGPLSISNNKQLEKDSTKQLEKERDFIKQSSSIDEANSTRSKALSGESKKRLLNGERKWPHLHSFLKNSSSKPSNNGETSRNDSNSRGCNGSKQMSYKKDTSHIANDTINTISNENSNMKSFRFSKGFKKVGFLKVSSSSESLKQLDSSDNTYNFSEDEGSDHNRNSKSSKSSMSKNLVSERKRRQKLNERLYSLRALVPTISKMDKASIVGDAINYVRDLQNQVLNMEDDIAHLEVTKEAISNGLVDSTTDPKRIRRAVHFHGVKTPRQQHQIVELDVTQMEQQLYQFRIHCKKSPGVLLQLTRALESLEFEIVSANLTSINDHILNTLVIEVANAHLTRSEDVRERTLEVIPKFGLFVSNS